MHSWGLCHLFLLSESYDRNLFPLVFNVGYQNIQDATSCKECIFHINRDTYIFSFCDMLIGSALTMRLCSPPIIFFLGWRKGTPLGYKQYVYWSRLTHARRKVYRKHLKGLGLTLTSCVSMLKRKRMMCSSWFGLQLSKHMTRMNGAQTWLVK